jgi:hypothetical protein
VSLVELTIVDLNNIWHDNQLKKSGKSMSPKVAAKSLHDPNKLGHFQKSSAKAGESSQRKRPKSQEE